MAYSAHRTGSKSEQLASQYLSDKGYIPVARNWQCKLGEIDLIMKDGDIVVFVEVRARQQTSYGEGFETIGHQKRQKIIRTAKAYMQYTDTWDDVRFDVVSIVVADPPRISHITDAFGV